MAIEYVVIRDTSREIVGIIDTAKSVIWHSLYYGVGDFEIYAIATPEHIQLLKRNNYVTRLDNDEVGIIEGVEILQNPQDGLMIVARGRFAKSILDRRLIYRLSGFMNVPTILRGRVENAIRTVVQGNAINCDWDTRRNIASLELGANAGIAKTIVDDSGNAAEKQVSYQNLLLYTDEVLEEYEMSAKVILNDDTKKLQYVVYEGTDRSDTVVFSREFDNLVESRYTADDTAEKNVALIGGEGEGKERFYSLLAGSQSGLSRRELFVDASSQNKKLRKTELQELFPSGTFSGLNFIVNGNVYATLITDLDREYSLSQLNSLFPSGVTSGTKFNVGGVTYANLIYGETDKYKLTPLGYKAMLDVEEQEGTYELTNTVYTNLLNSQGKQDLSVLNKVETFDGAINTSFGNWILNEDYFLGDIVTVQDNQIGKYASVRITEITEVQDENGYTVSVNYQ